MTSRPRFSGESMSSTVMRAIPIILVVAATSMLQCSGTPVRESVPPSDQAMPIVVSAPILRLPPLDNTGVLQLPTRAQGSVIVPEAHTLLSRWDFSLPARYRMGVARPEPEHFPDLLQAMYEYHSVALANSKVPRPMEPDFPIIKDFQTEFVDGDTGPIHNQAFDAQDRMRRNAWLMNGKQIMMLNNAQHKMRALTTQRLVADSEDPIEAKVLRSRLDEYLKQAHNDPSNTKTFPEVLERALRKVYEEQKDYVQSVNGRFTRDGDWARIYPFLFNREVDITHYLLRY